MVILEVILFQIEFVIGTCTYSYIVYRTWCVTLNPNNALSLAHVLSRREAVVANLYSEAISTRKHPFPLPIYLVFPHDLSILPHGLFSFIFFSSAIKALSLAHKVFKSATISA